MPQSCREEKGIPHLKQALEGIYSSAASRATFRGLTCNGAARA
jgi:hypothetical protein